MTPENSSYSLRYAVSTSLAEEIPPKGPQSTPAIIYDPRNVDELEPWLPNSELRRRVS